MSVFLFFSHVDPESVNVSITDGGGYNKDNLELIYDFFL